MSLLSTLCSPGRGICSSAPGLSPCIGMSRPVARKRGRNWGAALGTPRQAPLRRRKGGSRRAASPVPLPALAVRQEGGCWGPPPPGWPCLSGAQHTSRQQRNAHQEDLYHWSSPARWGLAQGGAVARRSPRGVLLLRRILLAGTRHRAGWWGTLIGRTSINRQALLDGIRRAVERQVNARLEVFCY